MPGTADALVETASSARRILAGVSRCNAKITLSAEFRNTVSATLPFGLSESVQSRGANGIGGAGARKIHLIKPRKSGSESREQWSKAKALRRDSRYTRLSCRSELI